MIRVQRNILQWEGNMTKKTKVKVIRLNSHMANFMKVDNDKRKELAIADIYENYTISGVITLRDDVIFVVEA